MQLHFATAADLKQCLALDWSYETDHVWQMQSHDSGERVEITFRVLHLPRAVTVNTPPDPQHVKVNWERQECFLAIEHQGQVLGFVDLTTQAWQQAGWINHLVVAHEFRGRGLGRGLMNAARAWAQDQKLRVLMVETQPKNYPAIQLYQQLGYKFCGYNDQFYPNDDIALFFACRLR